MGRNFLTPNTTRNLKEGCLACRGLTLGEEKEAREGKGLGLLWRNAKGTLPTNDWITHKLTTYLMRAYDTICLENLKVSEMMKNHKLAKSIRSASWSEFRRILEYKSEWYGKNLLFIGRFEPSSKMCHVCGHIKSDLKLEDREWECSV